MKKKTAEKVIEVPKDKCETCDGRGRVSDKQSCEVCNGTGVNKQ